MRGVKAIRFSHSTVNDLSCLYYLKICVSVGCSAKARGYGGGGLP